MTAWSMPITILLLRHQEDCSHTHGSFRPVHCLRAWCWTAQQAIIFARQNNPDNQLAAQRILQADAIVQKAAVGFYPQIELYGNGRKPGNNNQESYGKNSRKSFISYVDKCRGDTRL